MAGTKVGQKIPAQAELIQLRQRAADRLALFCDEIGKELDHGPAARRYALTGGRRALHGTVL